MTGDESFKNFILDQLNRIDVLHCKRMFGGWGLYQDVTFFGIIDDGRLFFKTNEETKGDYTAHQMPPFSYEKKDRSGKKKKTYLKNYYEVPVEVLENDDMFYQWAQKSVWVQQEMTK